MTYVQHFKLSMNMAKILANGSVKATIHAFLPDTYVTSTSDTVRHITHLLKTSGCTNSKKIN